MAAVPSVPPDATRRLLLIGWDAADWKLITPLLDAGQLPALASVVEQGVIGNLATLRPCLSPMLWTSIATGKMADKHGVLGFVEPLPDPATPGVRLVGSTTRQTKAFWNITSQAGLRTHVIGWYASHPAEPISGVCVTDQFVNSTAAEDVDWPIVDGAVHPRRFQKRFAELRVRPHEIAASDLVNFIPRLATADLRDPRPLKLANALAACASIHAVATDVIANEPWDVAAVYYDVLDRVGHDFMPYHPPRMADVSAADFALYSQVMTGLYRFVDMMLGALLKMVPDDTTVMIVSDHGFHSDHLRPAARHASRPFNAPDLPAALEAAPEAQAAEWHRQYGVLALRGPGIARDQRVYGATLLDVTPTLLTILGLPLGQDMDGKLLAGVFDPIPTSPTPIPSWDHVSGESGMHPPEARVDTFASAAAIEQLVDLGYLAPGTDGSPQALARLAAREAQFNLAVVHMQRGQPEAAVHLLRSLHQTDPAELRYAVSLAWSMCAATHYDDCVKLIDSVQASSEAARQNADLYLISSEAAHALGDGARSIADLTHAQQLAPTGAPQIACQVGLRHLAQGQLDLAETAFAAALASDPDSEQAHYGLAATSLRQGRWERAADHALGAVGLVHGFPQAHYVLGVALDRLGQTDRALMSLRTAIGLVPAGALPEAHRQLATILLREGEVESAMRHRRIAESAAPSTVV